MNELENARKTINDIDAELARLFEQRMGACRSIAAYKKAAGLPVRDTAREKSLIEKNCGLIQDPEIGSYYIQFLKNVIDLSCQFQTKLISGLRVSYSGVEGAFAYIAAKEMFPGAQLIACPDFAAAYRAVEDGEADCAVLPIENSYAGEVGVVMDLIFSGSLYVNRVIDVPVRHCLLGNPDATEQSVKTAVSHPQALDQCAEFLRAKDLGRESYANTALAAQYVKESGRTDLAAIASAETAEIFGLKILDRDIHDNKNNTTRFAAFSRVSSQNTPRGKSETESFILMFTVRNEAGALAQALDIIGAHGFNMRSLRSRPMKALQWSYYFYIEAEGNIHDENGKNMLRELSAMCDKLRLAGSYYAETLK